MWAAVPVEILGEYCCYDSYYTIAVKKKLWDRLKNFYQYYITQAWLGAVMETYGLNWNDERASIHEAYYIEEANRCLYEMICMLPFQGYKKIGEEMVRKKMKPIYDPNLSDTTTETHAKAKAIFESPTITPANKLEGLKAIFNPGTPLKDKQKPFWDTYQTNFVTAISIFMVLNEFIFQSPIMPDRAIELIDRSDINQTIKNLMTVDWMKYDEVTNRDQVVALQKTVMEIGVS